MSDPTHAIPEPMQQHKHSDVPVGLPPVPDTVNVPPGPPDPMTGHLGGDPNAFDPAANLGLAALRDSPPGVKPYYPYSTLIRYAIKGAPGQRLLLEDIYMAIEHRFPYFKTAPSGWKNSVRHNLSLNPCFEKMSRPLTDRGKGAYWVVNDNIDPRAGVRRDRKRKKSGSKAKRRNGDDESDSAQESPEPDGNGVAAMNGVMMGGVAIPGAPGGGVPGMPAGMMQTMVDENGNRIAFAPWPGYPGVYGAMGGPRYIIDPNEEEHGPEFDETGGPIWRTVWLNELVKLRRATYEQDTTNGDPEWYRAMVERVRAAFLQPEAQYIPPAEEAEEQAEAEEAES